MQTPIQYPKFEIGSDTYDVRVTLGTMITLEEKGVSITDFHKSFKQVAEVATLCLGKFAEGKWAPIAMSARELADSIEMSRLADLAKAITDSLVKAQPGTKTSDQTTPATTVQ